MSDLFSFESAPFNWHSIIGVFIYSRSTVHALTLEHLFYLISRWHARRLVEVDILQASEVTGYTLAVIQLEAEASN